VGQGGNLYLKKDLRLASSFSFGWTKSFKSSSSRFFESTTPIFVNENA
jgi:hypothetical protein